MPYHVGRRPSWFDVLAVNVSRSRPGHTRPTDAYRILYRRIGADEVIKAPLACSYDDRPRRITTEVNHCTGQR
jgi:hypothetical protein